MNLAFLGCGNVGAPIADHLQRAGHAVTLAAHAPGSETVKKALARNPRLEVASPKDALKAAQVVVLAVPYPAAAEAVKGLAAELEGKVLVDCTNPVGPGLSHGLGSKTSGTQTLQALLPKTKVVKAFSVYGFENFEDSAFPGYGVKPAMLFCGDDAEAKKTVAGLLRQLGWEPVDVGGAEQALHLEHMTLLWVRMVRIGGHSPHFVWAALER